MRDLRFHQGPFRHAAERAAYEALLAHVLSLGRSTLAVDGWRPFAFFDSEGRCAAALEAASLSLVLDGSAVSAAGIRSVAVAPHWRGRGLFRAAMEAALDWCDAGSAELTLLYTEEAALYGRFGFKLLAQHAFVGPSPPPSRSGGPAQRLDLSDPADRTLIVDILAARAPLSRLAALHVPPSLVLANLAKDAPIVAVAGEPPMLIVYETDGDTIVLLDIAGAAAPDLAGLLGALEATPRHLKTLFPPDRLGWLGEPVAEDTGLMVRGIVPEAMTRPFMFSPTVEF